MSFEQLVEEIFRNYENKHRDILGDVLLTSAQQAERILAKYDLSALTTEQVNQLKKMIVKREVDNFMNFVDNNKDILDGDFTDKQKFAKLFERFDNPTLTEAERDMLKKRIHRHIYDNEVGKILCNLVDNLKKKPQ